MIDRQRVIAYRSKAENDLTEARILLASDHPDGTCNRAYYALFNALLTVLHTSDGPLPKTHTGVHTEFRKQFILTGLFNRTYSTTITELFNLRQGGDYELDFVISIDDARDAVDKVIAFLSQVDSYLRANKFIP